MSSDQHTRIPGTPYVEDEGGHVHHEDSVAPESIAHARMRKTFDGVFRGGLSDLRSPEEKARVALNRVRPVVQDE